MHAASRPLPECLPFGLGNLGPAFKSLDCPTLMLVVSAVGTQSGGNDFPSPHGKIAERSLQGRKPWDATNDMSVVMAA